MIRGHDGEDVGRVITRRKERGGVVVAAIVARRSDEDDVGGPGRIDGVLERLFIAAAAPGVVHHPSAHERGVFDGGDGVGGVAAAAVIEKFERHDAHLPADAGHADAVVALGADGAGAMRAVVMVVHRIAIKIREVVAVEVVHEAVVVIVDAVARDFAGVDPDVVGQVGMGVIHAGVDDGDDHIAAAGVEIPGGGRINVRVGRAAGLPGVVHSPEFAEAGIVGRGDGFDAIIRLGINDPGHAVEGLQGLGHGLARRQFHQAQPRHHLVFADDLRAAQRVQHLRALHRLHSRREPHQQTVHFVFLVRGQLGEVPARRRQSDPGGGDALDRAPCFLRVDPKGQVAIRDQRVADHQGHVRRATLRVGDAHGGGRDRDDRTGEDRQAHVPRFKTSGGDVAEGNQIAMCSFWERIGCGRKPDRHAHGLADGQGTARGQGTHPGLRVGNGPIDGRGPAIAQGVSDRDRAERPARMPLRNKVRCWRHQQVIEDALAGQLHFDPRFIVVVAVDHDLGIIRSGHLGSIDHIESQRAVRRQCVGKFRHVLETERPAGQRQRGQGTHRRQWIGRARIHRCRNRRGHGAVAPRHGPLVEPLLLRPHQSEGRGIAHGDIVKEMGRPVRESPQPDEAAGQG